MGRTTRKRKAPAPVSQGHAPATGPKRFTATRFLSNCTDQTYKFLKEQWAEGNQLVAKRVPIDALPAVVILACFAREYGVELTDDYDALLERYDLYLGECQHPDKFFASCIVILNARGQVPDDASFDSINVRGIYEELLP